MVVLRNFSLNLQVYLRGSIPLLRLSSLHPSMMPPDRPENRHHQNRHRNAEFHACASKSEIHNPNSTPDSQAGGA